MLLCRSCVQDPVFAGQNVNMVIIAQIESSNGSDIRAYDISRYDIGKYQVSRAVLKMYNHAHGTHFIVVDLLQDSVCLRVATWYLNDYIPKRLRAWHLKDNVSNRLLAYNSGLTAVKHHHADLVYVNKYRKLEGI